MASAVAIKATTAKFLLGLRVRGRRGNGTRNRGLLRRSGRAMSAIRGATRNQGKGHDGEAGDDNFFHEECWFDG